MEKIMQSNGIKAVVREMESMNINAREEVVKNLSGESENYTRLDMIKNLTSKAFDKAVMEEINKMEKKEGRELTEAEVQSIVDTAIKENYHIIVSKVQEYIEQIKAELSQEVKEEVKQEVKEEPSMIGLPVTPQKDSILPTLQASIKRQEDKKQGKEEPKQEEEKPKKKMSPYHGLTPKPTQTGILATDKIIEESEVEVEVYEDIEIDGVVQKVRVDKNESKNEGKLVKNGATLVTDEEGCYVIVTPDGTRYDVSKNKFLMLKCSALKFADLMISKKYGIM